MRGDAIFSACRQFRFVLERHWEALPFPAGNGVVMFIGLNPSTADAHTDDPTVRRCIGYARAWGFTGLIVGNLFAYRSTLPEKLKTVDNPVGPDNNKYLRYVSGRASMVVAAWGNGGLHRNRGAEVMKLGIVTHHLGLTRQGQPKHPLYLAKDLKPIKWENAI